MKKIVRLALLQYSLYCGGLELNLQYLWGVGVYNFKTFTLKQQRYKDSIVLPHFIH